jgi:hypothetical protein
MKTLASALALAAALAGSAAAASDQLARNAGLSPMEATTFSRSELAAIKFNRDARQGDHQSIGTAGDGLVVKAGRSAAPIRSQLVAAAGLDPVEAGGLGLSELAAFKFDRDTAAGDRQSVRTFAAPTPDEIVWPLGDDDN